LAAARRRRQRAGGSQRDCGGSLAAARWRQQLGSVSGRAVAAHSATAASEIGCLV
jgi:hypothetical protein